MNCFWQQAGPGPYPCYMYISNFKFLEKSAKTLTSCILMLCLSRSYKVHKQLKWSPSYAFVNAPSKILQFLLQIGCTEYWLLWVSDIFTMLCFQNRKKLIISAIESLEVFSGVKWMTKFNNSLLWSTTYTGASCGISRPFIFDFNTEKNSKPHGNKQKAQEHWEVCKHRKIPQTPDLSLKENKGLNSNWLHLQWLHWL